MSLRSQTPKPVSVSLRGASAAQTNKNDTHNNQNDTPITTLVSELRATLTRDFDRVERALLERESRLIVAIQQKEKEIASLKVKDCIQSLDKLNPESHLREFRNGGAKVKKEENVGSDSSVAGKCMHCLEMKDELEKEKVVSESLRDRNMQLEFEKSELLEEKKKWDDQRGVVEDLMKRIIELEAEKCGLLEEKKKWDADKSGIDGLRKEESHGAHEAYRKRKFIELCERVSRLKRETAEDDKLISLDDNGGADDGDGSNTEENKTVQIDDSVEKDAVERNENVGHSSSKDGVGVTVASEIEPDLRRDYEDTLYRLDRVEHIAGRLEQLPARVLRTRRRIPTRPSELVRPLLRRAGFEHVAFILQFEHDYALVSALVERWRPETHTFHLPCGEMSITLQDVAYQLGLRISGDPVSGCMAGWELFYEGRSIVDICQQLLGAVPGPADRQKWNINLSWFRETVCGNLEEEATPERLLQYTRGYIRQLIGGFLFPDQSNTRVHLRWLPLLEDLDQCGQLSWGSAVLAFLYRMLCRGTCYTQHNMRGCMSLLLSWAYHRIPSCRPQGFDQRRFPLVERWVGYEQRNDSEEFRLRWWRRLLNNLDIHNVEWTPYADPDIQHILPPIVFEGEESWNAVCPLLCFSIVEWHQVDRVVRQLSGLQHIPTRPLNIDEMHVHDGRFGRNEWYPDYLSGWYDMWQDRRLSRVRIYHSIDLRPSQKYIQWYLGWAHLVLVGQGDQQDPIAGHIPPDLSDYTPHAPEL
ncbi:serine/threonine-protein phosphatase 7 long form homolog [Arachis stenosperma]|uniref:serine/threonine-protein phosphatase 7 long form homolog n=1 Tax=Arachis stenosperma TaxID=217475 RepID=UPI0025ABDFD2|nr:serine/threonine-protein phosphatase 7 long form homolog [Arachis stenosperma]